MGKGTTPRGGRNPHKELRKTLNRVIWESSCLSDRNKEIIHQIVKDKDRCPQLSAKTILSEWRNVLSLQEKNTILVAVRQVKESLEPVEYGPVHHRQ